MQTDSHFATGANGDEDLSQDIIMKGEKFHYKQGDPKEEAKEEPKPEEEQVDQSTLPLCNGTNGVPGKDCRIPSKVKKK